MRGTALVFILLGMAGLIGTGFAVRAETLRVREARASVRWPQTEGVVVETSLGGHRSGFRIRYRYSVGDQEYESTRIRDVEKFWSDTRSELAARYDEGDRVAVHYDPQRPDRALLEPGTTTAAVAKTYVVAAIIALLSLGVSWVGARGLRAAT